MSKQLSLTAGFVSKDGRHMRQAGGVRPLILPWLLGTALALGGTVNAGPGISQTEPPATGNLRSWNPRQTPIVEVVKHARDAIVNIHSERAVRPAAGDE